MTKQINKKEQDCFVPVIASATFLTRTSTKWNQKYFIRLRTLCKPLRLKTKRLDIEVVAMKNKF